MHSLHNILSYSPLGKIMIFTPQTVMRIINYIYKNNNKGRREYGEYAARTGICIYSTYAYI